MLHIRNCWDPGPIGRVRIFASVRFAAENGRRLSRRTIRRELRASAARWRQYVLNRRRNLNVAAIRQVSQQSSLPTDVDGVWISAACGPFPNGSSWPRTDLHRRTGIDPYRTAGPALKRTIPGDAEPDSVARPKWRAVSAKRRLTA